MTRSTLAPLAIVLALLAALAMPFLPFLLADEEASVRRRIQEMEDRASVP